MFIFYKLIYVNYHSKKVFLIIFSSDQVLVIIQKILEHLSNHLVKFLTKLGHISIYVYNKKAPVREYVDDYIRNKTGKNVC